MDTLLALGFLFLLGVAFLVGAWLLFSWSRRYDERLQRARRFAVHRCKIENATHGPCTVEGRWKTIAPGRAVVDDGRAALVVQYDSALDIADCERRFVFGYIDGLADDPRGGGFHEPARLQRLIIGEWGGVADDLTDATRSRPPLIAGGFGVLVAAFCGIWLIGWSAIWTLFCVSMDRTGFMAR
jgi:hypothetical protein